MKKTVFCISALLFLLLAGCKTPIAASDQFAMSQVAKVALTETIAITITPTSISYTSCVWNWASQSLPELSAALEEALTARGLKDFTAAASAYGENCIDPATNQVAGFATMETDWYITLVVPSLSDSEDLGDRVAIVLDVIRSLQDIAPGPNSGYVGLRFQADTGEQNLWFQLDLGFELLDQGLTGGDLFAGLQ